MGGEYLQVGIQQGSNACTSPWECHAAGAGISTPYLTGYKIDLKTMQDKAIPPAGGVLSNVLETSGWRINSVCGWKW